MIELKNRLFDLSRKVVNSIAFYPALIATGMAFFAIGVLISEQYGATEFLEKYIKVLVIYEEDTARSLLSVFIGGILSLTVFSFSMVMILLNQASSYFSPRLLPGLISNKSHQVVLGCYLGTIIYCILVLINIYKPNDDVHLPGLAILMAIIFGIFCLGMFVYFIHNISTSIQASNVLFRVFEDTRTNLEKMLDDERRKVSINEEAEMPDTQHAVFSQRTGYLQEVSEKSLLELAKEHDFVIQMKVTRGMFVLKNLPVAKTDRELSEEVIEDIRSCFQFSNREIVEDNYVLGFKQITEVAVKAMSPGINDPGTAITAIDFLTELFAIRLSISDFEWAEDGEGRARLFYQPVKFSSLMYNVMASLRQYVKHDPVIVQKLFIMMDYLAAQKEVTKAYREVLEIEREALKMDAEKHIENEHDRVVQNLKS